MSTENPNTQTDQKPGKSNGALTWLSNANNAVTTFGAIVAGIAAILASYNNAKIGEIDRQVKQLEFREKTQLASEKYAVFFMDKVLNDPSLIKSEKRLQAVLSLMNIVAQASSSDSGTSDAKARAIMPFQLALLLGQAGGVAAMDTDYRYLDDWISIASADNSTQTRVTAIQALTGVCQKALMEGRLDVLSKGVRAVDHLLGLIPEDQAAFRGSAAAARAQLAFFIRKEQNLLAAAKCPGPRTSNEDSLRAEIKTAFADAAKTTQETKETLTDTVAKLEDASQPNQEKIKEVKESLGQVNAALQTASTVTITEAMATPVLSSTGVSPAPIVATTSTDLVAVRIAELIRNLTDSDPVKQGKARSELALFGQKAVKPLLEIAKLSYAQHSKSDVRLEGMSEALRKMRQPIQLDTVDAYWAASVLRSPDAKARYDMAEFLMNLESGDSVRNSFDALEALFYESMASSKESGDAVANIATVVGTWARNIGRENRSRDAGKPFPVFALETAKKWRTVLSQSGATRWENTITTLDELIARASKGAS
jgi:hypothetical protein